VRFYRNLLRASCIGIFFGSLPGCSTGEIVEVRFPKGLGAQLVPVTLEMLPEFEDTTAVWAVIPPDCLKAKKAFAQTWIDRSVEGKSGSRRWKATFLWDIGSSAGGSTRLFLWQKVSGKIEPAFTFFEDRNEQKLQLFQNGSPVMTYIYGMNLKEGVSEKFRRSSYIHPVYGLDGEILSGDFPDDHLHHRGLFWAWPQVFNRQDSVDLWHLEGIHQRFEHWLGREAGPVFARFGVRNGWYSADGKVVDETVRVTVFKAGKVGRILDFEYTWQAEKTPVTLLGSPDEKGYGGFSFRFAPFEEQVINTSKGVQAGNSDLDRFTWVDFTAYFQNRETKSGVALFEGSKNIGFPNGWTLRDYGFLGIAWPAKNSYTLEPGKPVTASYRIWLHRGDAEEELVNSAYTVFASPPEAKFLQ